MNMTTSIRQIGGVTIVDISGGIVFGKESASLREVIHDLLSDGLKQIVLNLGAVDYIDTTGLGLLVGSLTTVRKRGAELKLFNLQEKVAAVMQTTNLYTVFDIVDGETAVVASLGRFLVEKGG